MFSIATDAAPSTEPVAPARVPSVKSAPVSRAEDRVEAITGIRKVMVKAMNDSLSIPHFGYCDEINADALIRYLFSAILQSLCVLRFVS